MFITILIFIAILAVLVLVHEFGHFIVAKKSGMLVEEFGFGFPPRIAGIKKVNGKWRMVWGSKNTQNPTSPSPSLEKEGNTGSTIYSINLIPLGGFVKILGENNEDEENEGSFINKSFTKRLLTLVAGVVMNVLLAWFLITATYFVGTNVGVNSLSDIPAGQSYSNPQMTITDVVKNGPADKAGIKPDDVILSIDGQKFNVVADIQSYVKSHAGNKLNFEIQRHGKNLNLNIVPLLNPATGQGPTGIDLALTVKLKYVWYKAIWEGLKSTYNGLSLIAYGLGQLFSGHVSFGSLGGPVQIARIVGQVKQSGFLALVNLTAFLSLNLAILNILPFPALDGGRVLFLLIEKIRGKRNNQKIEQIVNTAGFVFLLLLMVAVTVNDIIRK